MEYGSAPSGYFIGFPLLPACSCLYQFTCYNILYMVGLIPIAMLFLVNPCIVGSLKTWLFLTLWLLPISLIYSCHQVSEDLFTIWEWIMMEKLHIAPWERNLYSAILVVPETFDTRGINLELFNLLKIYHLFIHASMEMFIMLPISQQKSNM